MLGFSVGNSIVSWLLKRYLDKYIVDIDSRVKDFSYGLTGGSLLLKNLNLKAEALVGLDLPIEVKAGHIGRLELKLPGITSIYTEPIEVIIDKVVLLASPVCDRKYDAERDEALQLARKQETLNKLEVLLQEQDKPEEGGANDPVKDAGFRETLKITILQNLHVEITNIHIRYEDDVTNPKAPFAFGITLQELSLRPSENGQSDQPLFYNKLLTLNQLCVYWNCLLSDKQLLKNKLKTNGKDWKFEMHRSIELMEVLGVPLDYLVEPINGTADIVINIKGRSKKPLVSCTGNFKHIIINFKRRMFLNAIVLKDSFALMRVNEKFRKYHPGVSLSGNAKQWWVYAYKSIAEEVVKPKREFWVRIWQYRTTYKTYRDLYTEKLMYPDNADTTSLREYEMSLNIESIVMARKEAEKIFIEREPTMAVVKPANDGLIARLSNWWYGEPETEEVTVHAKRSTVATDDFLGGLSDSDKKELYKALNYSKDDDIVSHASPTYTKYLLDVKLEGIQLNLQIDSTDRPVHVATLFVSDITGYLAMRIQGLKFISSIQYLEVYNASIPTRRVKVAEVDSTPDPHSSFGDDRRLFSITVEQYPMDIEADVSVKVNTLPIRLVYNRNVACGALAFFHTRERSLDLGAQLRYLTPEFSTAGLQYAIDNHQRIYVEATLCSPYLIIPTDGVTADAMAKGKVIVDLGVLKVNTKLRPKNCRLECNSVAEQEKLIYDKYTLDIEEVKILYAKKVEWKEKRRLPDSNIHLMPSLNISTTVSLSAEPNFRKLPKFKVESKLNRLQVKMSYALVETLLNDIYKFPLPCVEDFIKTHGIKRPSGSLSEYRSTITPAGPGLSAAGNLMRSEMPEEGVSILDEVDFFRLQRLEEKNIFLTEGDLMNLWFLLSKEKSRQPNDGVDGSRRGSHMTQGEGLNAVADLLLKPDAVTVHNYSDREISVDEDEEFVDAMEENQSDGFTLPGLNGYTGDEFYTLAHTDFAINEVSFELLSGHQKYLTVRVNGVTGQACRTTCCASVKVQLRSFRITDHLHLNTEREKLHIARSPESVSMASFEGQFIDDVTKITFSDVSKAMVFNFNTIELCIQDESTSKIVRMLMKISKLLTVLQKSHHPVKAPSTAVSSNRSSIPSIQTMMTEQDVFFDAMSKFDTESLLSKRSLSKRSLDSQISLRRHHSQARRRSKKQPLRREVDVVDLDIKCILQNLSVELQQEFSIIAKLDVTGMYGEYRLKDAYQSVDAKLEALSLVDPMAPIYKQVVVVEQGLREVIIVHFKSFNQSEKSKQSCDQELKVILRRMRLIYINKFISRLTNFFSQFSSRASVERVQETSRSKISTTAQSAHKRGTKMSLSVEARSPYITVPENDESHNALLLRLGDLNVTNKFLTEQVKNKDIFTQQIIDEMTLTLDNIAIEGIRYVDEQTYIKRRDLLTPITTNLILRRALPPVAKTVVDFQVEASINQFTIETSQLDMQMVRRVIAENIMVTDVKPSSYDVTDVGSTISSALSSTTSSTSSNAKALTILLTLGGAILHLKHEHPTSNPLECRSDSLAVMDVAELKIDFCQGKEDSSMGCLVTLSNFTIVDEVPNEFNEFNTNNVVELEDGANQILLVKYDLEPCGNSSVFCSVEKMRFNVNLPFVKGIMAFLQDSFAPLKPTKPPKPDLRHPSRAAAKRQKRRINTTVVNRRLTVSAKKLSPARKVMQPSTEMLAVTPNITKMNFTLTLGKQSLYLGSGDGSQKALVAEVDVRANADMISNGSIKGDLYLNNLTVFSTSLRSEEAHLKHQCLKPCTVTVAYESLTPMSNLKIHVPPKVEALVKLTKMDISLSTNLIYHIYTAVELLQGPDTTDDTATTGFETNEVDINVMKDIDKSQWQDQYVFRYDVEDNFKQVEMNPMQAAVECLTVEEFDFDIEFSVAIGEEFVGILQTRSALSGHLKDWSTKPRAQCYFSLESNYYNELLDKWEPLLEPMFDGETGQYRRWEILARLTTAPSHPIARTDPSEILLDCQELDTFIHHQMSSAKEQQKAVDESPIVATQTEIYQTTDVVDQASLDDDGEEDFTGAGPKATLGLTVQTEELGRLAGSNSVIPETIMEEDETEADDEAIEEVIVPQPYNLQSAGRPPPAILFTQASDDGPHADLADGVATPSICQSLDERDLDQVDVTIDEKGQAPEIMCQYISLVSRDRLLLTASPQGVNVVTSIVDTFTKKPTDSTLFEVSKSHALTITNLLGIPACISLRTRRKHDTKLENVRVAEDMDVSESSNTTVQEQASSAEGSNNPADQPLKALAKLTAPTSDTSRKVFGLAKPPQITLMRQALHLAIDGFLPITNISFRRTQSRDFLAKTRSRRGENLCIRVRTQSKHGRKHVYIYSQLKIKNELQCPVQISYQEISYDESHHQHVPTNKSLGVIEPGAMLNIPAVVAQQKKLNVKPMMEVDSGAAGDFSESNEALWWREHLKAKSVIRSNTVRHATSANCEFLTCANQLQQTFTIKAVWIGRRCLAENCQGSCPSFDVLLKPPAEINNFLPFDIKLEIHGNSTAIGTQPSAYALEPGKNQQITDDISTLKRCYVTVPDYQSLSWKGSIDIHDKMSENRTNNISLTPAADQEPNSSDTTSSNTNPVTIMCHVTRVQGQGNSLSQLQITFYCSYWISNTTGRLLQFKASGIGGNIVETMDPHPILFMPSSVKKKMRLRIPGYKWSKSFAVDAAGTVDGVSCRNSAPTIKQRFMVETTLSNTQLTKIITIFPMFVVLNKSEEVLFYRESVSAAPHSVGMDGASPTLHIDADCGDEDEEDESGLLTGIRSLANIWTSVKPGEAKPFWPAKLVKPLSMVVKTNRSEDTTHSFPADTPQRTLLPLSGQSALTADVSGGLGTEYFITLRPYQQGDAVVRIENLTPHTILFSQGDGSHGSTLSVESSKSWLYYWPNPMHVRKLFWSIPELKSKPLLAQFSQDSHGQVKYKSGFIYWQSYGDNLQRILTFSDSELLHQIIQKRNQKEQATMFMFSALESVCVSLVNMASLEIALLTANHSPSSWSVKLDGQTKWFYLGEKLSSVIEDAYCKCLTQPFYKNQDIEINFSDLRFIRPISGLLRRESFPGIKFQYQKSEYSLAVQASINHLQIDNQLPDAFFPVVFHPFHTGYNDKISSAMKPCLGMFLWIQHPRTDDSTESIKKTVVSVEQFSLRIDKGFILTLVDFIASCRRTQTTAGYNTLMKCYHEKDVEYCLTDLATDTVQKTNQSSGTKIYVEDLRISNLQVRLSFSMAGRAHLTDIQHTQSSFGGDVVDFLLKSIGMTLTEVTDIEFNLGGFTVSCAVLTTGQLFDDTLTFYKSQAIRQAYVFLLGLDIIGDPLGLVKGVQRGLQDFFSSADPLNFSSNKSLTRGMKSAYSNIVGGLCKAGSKITESIGKGINVLTFDKRFQKTRLRAMRSRPAHFPGTLLLSGKTFCKAVASGVTGVALQPKTGVEKQGAKGLFKGVGKGVSGIFVKPVGGLFDSTSILLNGFRRVTQDDTQTVERMRLPRHALPSEGVSKYHPYMSEGVDILNSMSSYYYSPDHVYWSHLVLQREDKHKHVALATTRNLYLLYKPFYSSHLSTHWIIPLSDISSVNYQDGVISLTRISKPDEENEFESENEEELRWFHGRLVKLLSYSKVTYHDPL